MIDFVDDAPLLLPPPPLATSVTVIANPAANVTCLNISILSIKFWLRFVVYSANFPATCVYFCAGE